MTDRNQLKDRARDELFSHINRCGVLQAAHEDQEQWLDETMGYLGERYPDLAEADLRELHTLGLRFCRPAIQNVRDESNVTGGDPTGSDPVASDPVGDDPTGDEAETVAAGAEDGATG